VGQVNISETTYELVKDKFVCTHRGKITAKGKGEIDMYYVEER
jgi:class 3 adenylate cyclase